MGNQHKIDLYYFVFDDDNNQEAIHRQNVTIQGCNCNLLFINPKDFYDENENSFDREAFKEKVIRESQGKEISLIATDWNIIPNNDNFIGICGWDIIELVIQAKPKLENKRFLIYSGNIKDVSDFITEKIDRKENIVNEDQISKIVQKLLELKIKIHRRTAGLPQEIATILKESSTISSIVLNTIQSFGENKIHNTGNKYYDGGKIVDILKSEETDIKGLKFIREIIELAIARYSDLQVDDE